MMHPFTLKCRRFARKLRIWLRRHGTPELVVERLAERWLSTIQADALRFFLRPNPSGLKYSLADFVLGGPVKDCVPIYNCEEQLVALAADFIKEYRAYVATFILEVAAYNASRRTP